MSANFTTTEEHVQSGGVARVKVTYNPTGTVTLKTTYTAEDGRQGTDTIEVRENVYNYVDPAGKVDVTGDSIKRAIAAAGAAQ
jgi:hypothetical protein